MFGIINSSNSLTVSIAPKYFGSEMTGIVNYFDSLLLRYDPIIKGIALNYSNIKYIEDSGRLINESPYCLLRIQVDLTIFAPQIGSWLIGTVNKISPDHIGIIVYNLFNASIASSDLKPKWTQKGDYWISQKKSKIHVGTLVKFKVKDIIKSKDITSILGYKLKTVKEEVDLDLDLHPIIKHRISKIKMIYFIILLVLALVNSRHFTPIDLVSLKRLGQVSPHPAGLGALLTYSIYDSSSNTDTQWLAWASFNDEKFWQLTSSVHGVFWFSENVIGYVKSVNGTHQIFYSSFDPESNDFRGLDDYQLTSFPSSVGNVKFHQKSNLLTFVASVYSDGEIENSGEKAGFASGVVYDNLFVRHWDAYVNPQKFSQLFTLKLKLSDKRISIVGKPINLLLGTKLETPVAPDGGDDDYDISPDGKRIAFVSRVPNSNMAWNTNTDIYLVLVDGSEPPSAISSYNKGYDKHPKFSLDGSWIAWLQMPTPGYEADYNRIALYSVEPTADSYRKILVKDWDRSPESITWTENGLIISAQEIGRVKLFKVSFEGIVEPWISDGQNSQLTYVRNYGFVFVKSTLTSSPDIFVSRNGEVKQVTHLNLEYMKDVELSTPEEIWFQGAKGRMVHGWFFKPHNFDAKKTYPLAFLIHGGPEGAWNDDWGLRWNQQIFSGAGYAVVSINPTGSTGYGSEFTKAILGNWGSLPYYDLMKGLDFVVNEYQFIDQSRIAGLGASYGGYMVNWINGHTDRFACLVTHDGIFDTTSSYYETDELWFPEAEFGGVPFNKETRKLYEKYSPMNYVQDWKTPTLVIHGELDYRLPITQGLSVFTALQRQNIPSRLLYFPDENHWVRKHANSILWNTQVLSWLDQWTLTQKDSLIVQVY